MAPRKAGAAQHEWTQEMEGEAVSESGRDGASRPTRALAAIIVLFNTEE